MNVCLIYVIFTATIFFSVPAEIIPGCPSLSDSPQTNRATSDNAATISCFCDNGTEFGGNSVNSVVVNCLYPVSLAKLASTITQVTSAKFELYSVSVNVLFVDDSVDQHKDYFKTLNVYPSHLSIKSCTNLTNQMIVDGNLLRGLEESLVSLTIYNCHLLKLPSSLKVLKNLERIRLQRTSISEIKADDFDGFEKLLALDLQGNFITNIDSMTFSKLSNLQSLVLGPDNNLTETVFASLRPLTNLVTLDLSGNNIAKLDQKPFAELKQLQTLNLNENSILSLPSDAFTDLNQLIELHLTHNLIDSIDPNTFAPLKQLQSLYLSDNFLTDIDAQKFNLPTLKMLDLFSNEIKTLGGAVFSRSSNLTTLNLGENERLSYIDLQAFDGLMNLKQLDLSFTNISAFNYEWLKSIPQLTDLNLGNSQISTLDRFSFVNAPNLITLNLKSTKLRSIPDGLFNQNKNLLNLSLNGNDWSCDKELTYLLRWLQTNENNVRTAGEFRSDQAPTCANPANLRGLPLHAINIDQLA